MSNLSSVSKSSFGFLIFMAKAIMINIIIIMFTITSSDNNLLELVLSVNKSCVMYDHNNG